MKFREIKKRKMYKTWQHRNKTSGLVLYIHQTPKNKLNDYEYFHFEASCTKKYCHLEQCERNNCDKKFQYNSLNSGKKYSDFNECKEAIIKWYKRRL